jgi:CDP-6-deoxy-D-xylo-4-hexulose-3-dehydrase
MPADINLEWPLMDNNITLGDRQAVIDFLKDDPILTSSSQVRAFEEEWSRWLGVKHSVFVNSGSSANLATIASLRELRGVGEVIVPPITWVSDIGSLLHCGMTPIFADINLRTLGMDTHAVLSKITPRTKAVFLTHILGYNALTTELIDELRKRDIALIEDTCESHGAMFNGRKVGTFGWASNFSFYYAHHLSTIEGGMICTDDPDLYQMARLFRSHGLVRESTSGELKAKLAIEHPDLTPDFTFAVPGFNIRSTEINAVIGRSALGRLDAGIARRSENLRLFLSLLNPSKYYTDFDVEGSSNYALTLVLRHTDEDLRDRVEARLRSIKVEFRRGLSGGGNQLRQPYLRRLYGDIFQDYPVADFIHFFGFYIGNYPDLDQQKIHALTRELNSL